MAELIDGTTGHANYAPLSHGQTMSMGRHLQDQIRMIQQALADLGKGLGESNDAIADLKKNAGGANATITNLQEGLATNNTLTETLKNDYGRTKANVAKLQAGLEGTNGAVAGLIDGQKVNDTLIKKMQGEIDDQANRQHEFKENMEKKIESDIRALNDEHSKALLTIQQMKNDQDTLKDLVINEKEQLRQANLRAKDAQDRFNDMDTFVKILEKRVADGATGLKSTRMNLEDLNNATLKLHEDHEGTKGRVGELHDGVKKAHNHVKTVHNKLEGAAQMVNNAQQRIDAANNNAEDLKAALDVALSRINDCEGGAARASGNISEMKRELAQTSATANAVRAGLKESNSLLLPNIHLDSSEARGASQRHGSLLHTGNINSTGLPSPRKTPRAPGASMGRTQQNWT
jgi:chromosome segregation ATPase